MTRGSGSSKQIIPYKGIVHYEQMAIQDVKNINKIYKPKTEALKTAWREAVLLAQQLEQLTSQERISRCDMARLRERGGKALQKKMEFESKRRSSESDDSTKGRRSSESSDMKSPERFKSPTSPRKPMEKEGEERLDKEREIRGFFVAIANNDQFTHGQS